MNKGWKTEKLCELAEIELGKTPARANASFWDEKKTTRNVWLSIADLLNAEGNVVSDSKEYISDKGAALCSIVRKGTLLVSFKLTLGRLAFAGRDLYTNEAIAALTLFNELEVSREYLFWYFQFFDWQKAAEGDVKIKGMTLNKAKLREIAIEFPPLPEQQRIVALLDEAFAGLATAKANAERNLRNARALFESHLTVALSSDGKKWPSRQLDSLLIKNRKISYGIVKPGIHDPNGVRIIKSQQVRDSAMDLTEDFRITRELDEEYARTRLQGGEVLLNLVGASIGRSAIAPSELKGANVSRAIAVIPVHHEFTRWVQYNLRCSVGQTMIQAKTGGAAQPVLNLSEVKSMGIPFPPLNTQQAIVESLESLREETQRLTRLYEQKLAALEALKKSLLHRAFSGEL